MSSSTLLQIRHCDISIDLMVSQFQMVAFMNGNKIVTKFLSQSEGCGTERFLFVVPFKARVAKWIKMIKTIKVCTLNENWVMFNSVFGLQTFAKPLCYSKAMLMCLTKTGNYGLPSMLFPISSDSYWILNIFKENQMKSI